MSDHHEHNDISHVASKQVLFGVFGALLFLTGVTVWVAQYDLGRMDLTVAMGIASVKAALVALYFMHLRYDKALNSIVFVAAILFVLLFLGITVIDLEQLGTNSEGPGGITQEQR